MNTEETKIFTSLPAIIHCILSWDAKRRMTKYSGLSDIFHDRREWNISQKMNEWMILNKILWQIIHRRNENSHTITCDNQLYFVRICEASNVKMQWIIGYYKSFTSLFLSGNDVNIWVSDGFTGVYYMYSFTVTITGLFWGIDF